MHPFASLLFLLPLASAHMQLRYPAPLNAATNPNTIAGSADYSYTSPLTPSNYPCKGYHSLLGTPAGKPVTTWAAGSTQNFTLDGSAIHGGGSCQASISEDGGKTFRVVRSFVGGCPALGKEFAFVVPKETRNGDVLFAWSWFNNLGNREMYMNCAAVSITGGGSGGGLVGLPEIFRANLGDGCTTVPSKDLLFPVPGGDVVVVGSGAVAPVGSCGGGGGGGGGGGAAAGGVLVTSATSTSTPFVSTTIPLGGTVPTTYAPLLPTTLPSVAALASTPTSTPFVSTTMPSKASTASTKPAPTAKPADCMCVCGVPGGYALNALPSSSINKLFGTTTPALTIDHIPAATEFSSMIARVTTTAAITSRAKSFTKIKTTGKAGSAPAISTTKTVVKVSRSGRVEVTKTLLSIRFRPTGHQTDFTS